MTTRLSSFKYRENWQLCISAFRHHQLGFHFCPFLSDQYRGMGSHPGIASWDLVTPPPNRRPPEIPPWSIRTPCGRLGWLGRCLGPNDFSTRSSRLYQIGLFEQGRREILVSRGTLWTGSKLPPSEARHWNQPWPKVFSYGTADSWPGNNDTPPELVLICPGWHIRNWNMAIQLSQGYPRGRTPPGGGYTGWYICGTTIRTTDKPFETHGGGGSPLNELKFDAMQ